MKERLGVLEPVAEDWHCLVIFLTVSCWCAVIGLSLLPDLISRLPGSFCLARTADIMGHLPISRRGLEGLLSLLIPKGQSMLALTSLRLC